jgi:hypothetical protein
VLLGLCHPLYLLHRSLEICGPRRLDGILRLLLRVLRITAAYHCCKSQYGRKRQDWHKARPELLHHCVWGADRDSNWGRGVGPRWVCGTVDVWRGYVVCECGLAGRSEGELERMGPFYQGVTDEAWDTAVRWEVHTLDAQI